ncbi:hypothetical protein KY289_008354 [Solanum tuberosum]|nr:hypothetical protein KY289_008354 [Solanum tuberosum]
MLIMYLNMDFPSVDLAFGKAKAYPVVTILFWPRNKYLLKIMDSGQNVRLQYRSLRKFLPTPETEERCQSQTVQNSS